MPESALLIVYLDEYHAGDRLLIDRLGRAIAAQPGRPLLLIHDPAEAVRAALEAAGVFEAHASRVEANFGLVERAVRVSNKRIVSQLTEAGAPAFGVLGLDRGLMKGDLVTPGGAAWLQELCGLGTVPVVSPLSSTSESTPQVLLVEAGQLLVGLARQLPSEATIILFNKQDKSYVYNADGQRLTKVAADDAVLLDKVHDPAWADHFSTLSKEVIVTNVDGFLGLEEPVGTRIGKRRDR